MEKIILGDGSIINELVPIKGVPKRYYRVIKSVQLANDLLPL